MLVETEQRYTQRHPCPVCGGCDGAPRGEDRRCWGFVSSDGQWAHCTRSEYAGPLQLNPSSGTYSHRLGRSCNCGGRHDERTPADQSSNGSEIVATYDYRDAIGRRLFQVIRYHPKSFRQRRPDGHGGWHWDLHGVERVLYRLPDLLAADGREPVFIPEGEKDADRLADLGLVATTNPGGAGKWHVLEDLEPLRDRRVVVLPDNDQPGGRHAQQVAQSLQSLDAGVKVVDLPGLPEKGDVSDWLDGGHTKEELLGLIAGEAEWQAMEPPSGDPAGQDESPQLQVVSLKDVHPSVVQWIWPRRIPKGKLTLIGGDPGLGKSYLSLDIAARISQGGPWPDEGVAPRGNVLILSAEDGVGDTIRPRLDLLGADLSRIHAINTTVRQGDKELALSLAEHLNLLELEIFRRQALLLVLDPILAFTGRADTHKSAEVRAILAPLMGTAERTGCAVLAVIHLNKRSGESSSIYRLMASLDFAAAARSVFVVGKHPADPDRRVLAAVKANLSAMADSLAFRFDEDGLFAWDGVVALDANDILAAPLKEEAEEATALSEAVEFLLEVLVDGPVESKDVLKEAKEAGLKERTLDRAKTRVGVVAIRKGKGGQRGGGIWYWSLPVDLERQTAREGKLGALNQAGDLNQEDPHSLPIGTHPGQPPLFGQHRRSGTIKSAKPDGREMAPLIPDDVVVETQP